MNSACAFPFGLLAPSRPVIPAARPAIITRGIPANTRGEYARRLAKKAW
jgi:hypothetical protein